MTRLKIKDNLNFIVTQFLSLLSSLIPKNSKKIMFFSYPRFQRGARSISVNTKYLYDKMVEMGLDKRLDLIWAFEVSERLSYISNILTSKYIISTHVAPYWKSRNQILIMLYHEFPTKAGNEPLRWIKNFNKRTDYLITTSSFGSVLFSKFQISLDKVLVLGQPRYDPLFKNEHEHKRILKQVLEESYDPKKLMILYVPTFREESSKVTCYEIVKDLMESHEFREFLRSFNLQFIIKPHPMDETIFQDSRDIENISIVTNKRLGRFDVTIYDFLRAIDIMVTDYSSVASDYLLINRPIIYYVLDIDDYREKRGLILEPYELWTPGDKAKTIRELIKAIDEAIKNPNKWEKERAWLRDVSFIHKDGGSSERIIQHFWGSEISKV